MRYEELKLTGTQVAQTLTKAALLGAVLDYLFYESWWMLALLVPFGIWELRREKHRQIEKRKKRLEEQFRMALRSLGESLYAGYSVENAITLCRKELEPLFGKEAELAAEFRAMESKLKVNATPEQLFLDLGVRSNLVDLRNFASVFFVARRAGGDLGQVVRLTARMMEDKWEASREIEATLAARKTEQQIMSLMPAGILLYLKWTSPGYLTVLYGSILGRGFMTVCLLVYGGAYLLGKKMVEIEV